MTIRLREEILDLHKGREALTLLHISDIHLWFSGGILHKLKLLIRQHDPELVLFTGDYFDTPRGAYLFSDFLRELSLSYPIAFIRGNHDFLYGPRIADLFLDIPNCCCIENELYTFTSRKGFTYHITSWDQRHRLQKHVADKNIVLIHNPEKLREQEMEGIDLILAGHLHGGQFILFTTLTRGHFPGNLLYKYCIDRRLVNNTAVIISKGLSDTFPIRVNCAREVIKVKII